MKPIPTGISAHKAADGSTKSSYRTSGDLVSGEIKHTATPWQRDEYGNVEDAGGNRILLTGFSLNMGRSNPIAGANTEFIVRACNAHDALAKAVQAEFALVCMPIREGEELSRQIGWNGKEDRNIFCRRLRYAAIAALAK